MYILSMRRSKFSGVYSIPADRAAKRRKTHYFVWQLPGGAYAVQELNAAFQPVSEAEFVDGPTFARKFTGEPSVLTMPVIVPDLSYLETLALQRSRLAPQPSGNAAQTPPTAGERSRPQPSGPAVAGAPATSAGGAYRIVGRAGTDAAAPAAHRAFDLEAARKARVLESRMRETFRQTLLRLKRPRERKAAMLALEQIARTTEGIVPAHKHMFRDFGVRLRQNFQPALALLFNRKAVELAPEDDHARFNLARILCALGQYDEAAAHIRAAMTMDGNEPLYKRLLAHILILQQKGVAPRPVRRR
jgi:tetratricopeptide (TPR) repeat protein